MCAEEVEFMYVDNLKLPVFFFSPLRFDHSNQISHCNYFSLNLCQIVIRLQCLTRSVSLQVEHCADRQPWCKVPKPWCKVKKNDQRKELSINPPSWNQYSLRLKSPKIMKKKGWVGGNLIMLHFYPLGAGWDLLVCLPLWQSMESMITRLLHI